MLYKHIIGNGLHGRLAAALYPAANHYIGSNRNRKRFQEINSIFTTHLIGNVYGNGLSQYYHGLTPKKVFENQNNTRPLEFLGLETLDFSTEQESAWLVLPRNPPRPKNIRLSNKNRYFRSLTDLPKSQSVLALSCLGNATYLLENQFIDLGFEIDDDIVIRLGSTSDIGNFEVMPKSSCKTLKLFPGYRCNEISFYFRPIFEEDTLIDFTNIAKNFYKMSQVTEKIKRMIFARYGTLVGQVSGYEVIAQAKVQGVYKLLRNGNLEVDNLKIQHRLSEVKDVIESRLLRDNVNMTYFKKDRILTGIHLSYNREQLYGVPDHLFVSDTSLGLNNGYHNTIDSLCEAYKILSVT